MKFEICVPYLVEMWTQIDSLLDEIFTKTISYVGVILRLMEQNGHQQANYREKNASQVIAILKITCMF